MSRNPEIEAILEAWWELEHLNGPERTQASIRLNQLLDDKIAKSGGKVNRYQLQSALTDRYKTLRAEKRRLQKVAVAQSSMDPSAR